MQVNLFLCKQLLIFFFLIAPGRLYAQVSTLEKQRGEFEPRAVTFSVGMLKKTAVSLYEIPRINHDKQLNNQKTDLLFNRNVNTFLGLLTAVLLGIIVFIYCTLQRTTRLNKVISEQKAALESLGHVKDRIFSVVSHDMRSPINSLISFTQLLEDGDLTPVQLRRYATSLKNALGYTSNMMENLLNWASSQMQGFSPLIEIFDSQICVQEVLNTLQPASTQKAICIENKVPPGLLCLADVNMTALVLRNLLSNAIKFTPNGGHVAIDVHASEAALFFTVADNGIGINQDHLHQINEGCAEIGRTKLGTNNERGTGIGLMLCKTFTSLMGGKLTVTSTVGEGSVFTLILPRAK